MSSSPASIREFMWRFLALQKWRIAGAVAAGVLTICSSMGLLAVSAYLIERASQRPPILSLEIAIVSVRFLGISRGVFRYLDRVLAHDASFRLLSGIRADTFRTLIPLAPAQLGDTRRGDLLARIAADVDTMQEWFVRGFAPLVTSVVTAVIAVAMAAYIVPAAGVALGLILLIASVLATAATWLHGSVARRESALRGLLTSGLVDYVQGLADLTALNAAESMAARIEEWERESGRLSARRSNRNGLGVAIQTALPGLVAASLVSIATARLHAGLNPLQIGVLCLGGMAAVECVAAVPGAADAWDRGRAAAQRIVDIAAIPRARVRPSGSARLVTQPTRLTASGVSFRYGATSPYVLESLSLDVSMGERVVIVGRSGSGKTTLADLLLRFLSPCSGAIALDGVNLLELDEDVVRQSVGATTQDAHLFAGTIRDNIKLARPQSTDDDLRVAIEGAHLARWMDRLPDGWNTEVGERGIAVSGGQRRRIALARALLAGFPFLIADEPTEGLDTPTALAVMDALFTSTAERGLVVITHRPDLCPPADSVYRLENGRLIRIALSEELHTA